MAYLPSDIIVGQPVYLTLDEVEEYMTSLPPSEPLPPSGNYMPLSPQFQEQMVADVVAASASQVGQDETSSDDSSQPIQRGYVCQICMPNCSFIQQVRYVEHMSVSHPDQKKFACWIKECNVSKKSAGCLARHYVSVHVNPELRPICIRCNQAFGTVNSLSRHMPRHFLYERTKISERATGRVHYYSTPCILVKSDAAGKKYYDREPRAKIKLILRNDKK